jgi:HPt (histidine-containing phosphotransfer) domain-containing protein
VANLAKSFSYDKLSFKPASGRPIDLVHLSRQSLGDPGLEEEILRTFDQLVQTYVARIREAGKSETVLFNLHCLKGASSGVGANSIAALARSAEEEVRRGGALSGESMADLGMAAEEVRTFIASLLDD